MSNDIEFPVIERATYPAGVPCMVDTEQADPLAAAAFYGAVFGWEFQEMLPAGSGEHYMIASLGGRSVAAVASPTPGLATGASATWNTYVSVADADAALERAEGLGARRLVDPVDVGPPGSVAGRWAAFVDPTGAHLRLWQPGTRHGAQLVNAPGSWNSSDLHTADPQTATTFFRSLFGWETMSMTMTEEEDASIIWRLPGYGDFLATLDPGIRERNGAIGAPEGFTDAVGWLAPSTVGDMATDARWMVTFGVADVDATVERAVASGAVIESGPTDLLGGMIRTATIRDPQDADLVVASFDPTAR